MRQHPELPALEFSTNWNGKLENRAFTTLRLPAKRYFEGARFEVMLKDKSLGVAKIEAIASVNPVSEINTFTAFIDTGYSPAETCSVISKMYAKDPDILKKEFWLLLLVKEK